MGLQCSSLRAGPVEGGEESWRKPKVLTIYHQGGRSSRDSWGGLLCCPFKLSVDTYTYTNSTNQAYSLHLLATSTPGIRWEEVGSREDLAGIASHQAPRDHHWLLTLGFGISKISWT